MNVSEATRTLSQIPPRHPLFVQQGEQVHEILAIEYSYEPSRAVLKIAEVPAATLPEPAPSDLLAGFDVWWSREGSGMPPLPYEDASQHVHRLTQIAWSNGRYVRTYPLPLPPKIPESVGELIAHLVSALAEMREDDPANKALEDAHQMFKGGMTCWRKYEQAAKGRTERCEGGCDAPVVTHDVEGVPLCRECADELAKSLPEPEATIAELNGEVPPAPVPVEPAAEPLVDETAKPAPFKIGEILAEVLPPETPAVTVTEPDAAMPAEVAATLEGAPVPAPKRTRKPKVTPPAEPETT